MSPLQVKPLWGQRLKRVCPDAQYYEVSPAGHCPHHEAPATVALVLSSWISQVRCNEGIRKHEFLGVECYTIPCKVVLSSGIWQVRAGVPCRCSETLI